MRSVAIQPFDLRLIPQRIEILFWWTVIYLMKEKKSLLLFPILLFLAVCSLLGYLAVASADLPAQAAGAVPVAAAGSGPFPTVRKAASNGQRNVLIVGVDRLDAAQPRLEGIWLAAYLPPTPRLTILPLYPASLSGGAAEDSRLESLFRLQPGGMPEPAFLSALQEKDLWWNNYVVVESSLLGGLTDAAGGVSLGEGEMDGQTLLAALPHAWDNPKKALRGQAKALEALCGRAGAVIPHLDAQQIYSMASRHMVSDFSANQILSSWQALQGSGDSLSCEFPTLSREETAGPMAP
jgi:hypothetical protein